MFQSFCVNGFLWKVFRQRSRRICGVVSILLCQWIPLEDVPQNVTAPARASFNPSVSM